MTPFFADFLGELVHNLLHRHARATKPEVGTIWICSKRFSGQVCGRYFAVAEGPEPVWRAVSAEQFDALTAAGSLAEARGVLAGAL